MQDIANDQIDYKREHYIAAQLEIFEIRSRKMAGKVNAGLISMADGADMLYSAAVWSGLADNAGDDLVQQIMARSFMLADAAA